MVLHFLHPMRSRLPPAPESVTARLMPLRFVREPAGEARADSKLALGASSPHGHEGAMLGCRPPMVDPPVLAGVAEYPECHQECSNPSSGPARCTSRCFPAISGGAASTRASEDSVNLRSGSFAQPLSKSPADSIKNSRHFDRPGDPASTAQSCGASHPSATSPRC